MKRRAGGCGTETRPAWQEPEKQARYLELFFQSSLTPLALLDPDFNFIRVNEVYARLEKRNADEFPGRNFFSFHPSVDIREVFSAALRARAPLQATCHWPARSGCADCRDWTLTPLLGADGRVEVLVLALDTERRSAEKIMQAERKRFNDILELLPAYLILMTPDHRVIFANRFFRERFGESHEQRCFEYLFGRSEPCDNCEAFRVLQTMAPHEWEWLGPDGRHYHIFDFPFTDTDGAMLVMEVGLDISMLKRAEAALREANSTLEIRVAERTAELAQANACLKAEIEERRRTEQALRLNQEELAAANEELTVLTEELEAKTAELDAAYQDLRKVDRHKNEFLAVLSHELRNPLAAVRNSLGIMDRAAPGSGQAARAKEIIRRQCEQLSRLVDDLLDVTRITLNKIRLQRRRLELNELVRRTVEDFRAQFEQNGVNLETEFSSSPLFVSADAARLAQVVGNLVHNAVKFTRAGGSTFVSVARDEAGWAVIRVVDSGVGIPAEMLPRLFKPFMQADKTLDRSRSGLGLGLALVRGLVELHGGEVSARSAGPDRGSEFVVRLPLDVSGPEEAKAEAGEIPRARRRMLIIEDNVDLAESLRELLELDGHEIEVAYNGPDGLRKARTFHPEVLLCDIGLPGMDGYAVARAFRDDEALCGVFRVALTGYAHPEDMQLAEAAGFDAHLAKPPDFAALGRLLARVPARN